MKQCEIVINKACLNVDIIQAFKKHDEIQFYAYQLHNKDNTNPHYHIYLKLNPEVESNVIAKWFNVSEKQILNVKGKCPVLKYINY